MTDADTHAPLAQGTAQAQAAQGTAPPTASAQDYASTTKNMAGSGSDANDSPKKAARENEPELAPDAVPPSGIDYKAKLDEKADAAFAAREKAKASGKTTQESTQESTPEDEPGLVTKVVHKVASVIPGPGKSLLGLGGSTDDDDNDNDSTDIPDATPSNLPAQPVEAFIRDAHRSHKINPASADL